MAMAEADIGLVGLAVMGQNLVLNINDHNYRVAVYNRTTEKVDRFLENEAAGTDIIGTRSLEEFVASLKRPRRIILMIKAGKPVDLTIESIQDLLEPGDVLIDGGNSYYEDTKRRMEALAERGINYIGMGISGGEEGARHGPSMMPGGAAEAWPSLKDIFQSISAKAPDGAPCCEWMGADGAGHFVKMVHNGIEYGDIQLITETYHLMREVLGLTPDEMSTIFRDWNKGKLDSYLIEITGDILAFKDEDGAPMIDKILDTAGQKGTGKWTATIALDEGMPLTLISEAVFARFLSAIKDERVKASGILSYPDAPTFDGDRAAFIADLEQALYASKLVSYAQGFMLMRAAAASHDWDLNYGTIASIWRAGCIIRSAFLGEIKQAYDRQPDLENLLFDDYFKAQIMEAQNAWRRVIARAVAHGIPTPAMSSALAFFDGYRTERLPANLLQAQRDYFGAHTYERIDKPRGEFFHTNWTGRGGVVTSGTYDA